MQSDVPLCLFHEFLGDVLSGPGEHDRLLHRLALQRLRLVGVASGDEPGVLLLRSLEIRLRLFDFLLELLDGLLGGSLLFGAGVGVLRGGFGGVELGLHVDDVRLGMLDELLCLRDHLALLLHLLLMYLLVEEHGRGRDDLLLLFGRGERVRSLLEGSLGGGDFLVSRDNLLLELLHGVLVARLLRNLELLLELLDVRLDFRERVRCLVDLLLSRRRLILGLDERFGVKGGSLGGNLDLLRNIELRLRLLDDGGDGGDGFLLRHDLLLELRGGRLVTGSLRLVERLLERFHLVLGLVELLGGVNESLLRLDNLLVGSLDDGGVDGLVGPRLLLLDLYEHGVRLLDFQLVLGDIRLGLGQLFLELCESIRVAGSLRLLDLLLEHLQLLLGGIELVFCPMNGRLRRDELLLRGECIAVSLADHLAVHLLDLLEVVFRVGDSLLLRLDGALGLLDGDLERFDKRLIAGRFRLLELLLEVIDIPLGVLEDGLGLDDVFLGLAELLRVLRRSLARGDVVDVLLRLSLGDGRLGDSLDDRFELLLDPRDQLRVSGIARGGDLLLDHLRFLLHDGEIERSLLPSGGRFARLVIDGVLLLRDLVARLDDSRLGDVRVGFLLRDLHGGDGEAVVQGSHLSARRSLGFLVGVVAALGLSVGELVLDLGNLRESLGVFLGGDSPRLGFLNRLRCLLDVVLRGDELALDSFDLGMNLRLLLGGGGVLELLLRSGEGCLERRNLLLRHLELLLRLLHLGLSLLDILLILCLVRLRVDVFTPAHPLELGGGVGALLLQLAFFRRLLIFGRLRNLLLGGHSHRDIAGEIFEAGGLEIARERGEILVIERGADFVEVGVGVDDKRDGDAGLLEQAAASGDVLNRRDDDVLGGDGRVHSVDDGGNDLLESSLSLVVERRFGVPGEDNGLRDGGRGSHLVANLLELLGSVGALVVLLGLVVEHRTSLVGDFVQFLLVVGGDRIRGVEVLLQGIDEFLVHGIGVLCLLDLRLDVLDGVDSLVVLLGDVGDGDGGFHHLLGVVGHVLGLFLLGDGFVEVLLELIDGRLRFLGGVVSLLLLIDGDLQPILDGGEGLHSLVSLRLHALVLNVGVFEIGLQLSDLCVVDGIGCLRIVELLGELVHERLRLLCLGDNLLLLVDLRVELLDGGVRLLRSFHQDSRLLDRRLDVVDFMLRLGGSHGGSLPLGVHCVDALLVRARRVDGLLVLLLGDVVHHLLGLVHGLLGVNVRRLGGDKLGLEVRDVGLGLGGGGLLDVEVRLGGGELRLELIDVFSVTCILRILKLLAENLHVLLGLRDGGDGILGRLDLVLELIDHHLGGVGGDDGILPRLLGFGGGVVRVGGDVASPHLDNLELDDGDGLLVSPVFVDRVLEFDRELEGAVGHCVDRGGSLLGRSGGFLELLLRSRDLLVGGARVADAGELLVSGVHLLLALFVRVVDSLNLRVLLFEFPDLLRGLLDGLLRGDEVVDRLDENLRLLRLLDGVFLRILGGDHLALDRLDRLVRLPRLRLRVGQLLLELLDSLERLHGGGAGELRGGTLGVRQLLLEVQDSLVRLHGDGLGRSELKLGVLELFLLLRNKRLGPLPSL